jgi:hypothetical protein
VLLPRARFFAIAPHELRDPALSFGAAFDVSLGGTQAGMARQLLDVPERTAGLDDTFCKTSDVSPAPAVARCAFEPELPYGTKIDTKADSRG